MMGLEEENPYGFAGWRLKELDGGVAFSNRLAMQSRPFGVVVQITYELLFYVKLHVMLLRSLGQE